MNRITRHCIQPHSGRFLLIALMSMFMLALPAFAAGGKILIIEPLSGFSGNSIKTHLTSILQQAGVADVQVAVTGPTLQNQTLLSGWLHNPYNDAANRWSNLSGQAGTAWDYVVIMENPQVIESFPGWYAQGVHDVAKEVERGAGEAVLLMQWPTGSSTTTMDYYREVTYRVGYGRDLKVVPAGLARQSAGNLNAEDSAYITAASIYSQLFNANAADVSNYNDTLAQTAFDIMTANKTAVQYSGPFNSSPTGIHRILGVQKRFLRMMNDGHYSVGTPTEGVINGNTWKMATAAGIINDVTDSEKLGGENLPKSMVRGPTDLAYREFRTDSIASDTEAIRDVDSQLYLPYRWSHLVDFSSYESTVSAVQTHYNNNTSYLDSLWRAGDTRLRELPNPLLLAQSYRELQTSDETIMESLNKQIIAAYNFTMLTGRCPMIAEETNARIRAMQRLGYEAAWRFSTLHGRAPGFKTWPVNRECMTVDPANGTEIKVAFLLPPKADVTVTITTTNPIASVTPNVLTFTPANYATPQTVTVNVAAGSVPQTPFDVIFTTASDDIVCDGLTQSWDYKVNTPPVAYHQSVIAYAGQLTPINLTGTDPDIVPLKFASFRQPFSYELAEVATKGQLSLPEASAIYTPAANATGSDSFTFRTKDFNVRSQEATVSITIQQPPLYAWNLLVNGSAEFAPFSATGWVEGLSCKWEQTVSTVDGSYGFSVLSSPKTAEIHQNVDVTRYSSSIGAGNQTFRISGYVKDKGISDDIRIIANCLDASMQVLASFDSGDLTYTGASPLYTADILAPVGTATIRFLLRGTDGADKGGTPNTVYFDALSLTAIQPPQIPFQTWMNGYNVGGQVGFVQDPDGDGIPNGLESFFGTSPAASSSGVAATMMNRETNTFVFSHPLNPNPPADVSASYRWSTNVETFHLDGASDGATSVTFSRGIPSNGQVTVTATISGAIPERLFFDIMLTHQP